MPVYLSMNDTHDMAEHDTAVRTDMAPPAHAHVEKQSVAKNAPLVPAASPNTRNFTIHPWAAFTSHIDNRIAKARDASPAWLVNNGSRLCLALKFSADGFSIASAQRRGSKSPWRLKASLVTMGAEVLGMIFPEKDISDEKRASYLKMSPLKFFGTKTVEALNPRDYITETSGLALIVNGAFMALSGKAQSSPGNRSPEILQGLMTSAAGMLMTYWPDRERAWQLAHTTFIARSVPALKQVHKAYYVGNPAATPPVRPGDWYQGAKWVLNMGANFTGTLYGGVKKMPDGSILHIGKHGEDVTAPRQSRRLVESKGVVADNAAIEELKKTLPSVKRHEKKSPTTRVSHVAVDEKKHALASAAVSL